MFFEPGYFRSHPLLTNKKQEKMIYKFKTKIVYRLNQTNLCQQLLIRL